jgi:hypothetical protein
LVQVNAKLLQKRKWADYTRKRRFTRIVPIKTTEKEKGIEFAASEWKAAVSSELKSTSQGP